MLEYCFKYNEEVKRVRERGSSPTDGSRATDASSSAAEPAGEGDARAAPIQSGGSERRRCCASGGRSLLLITAEEGGRAARSLTRR